MSMHEHGFDRRRALQALGAAGFAGMAGASGRVLAAGAAPRPNHPVDGRSRSIRVAHLTDTHIQPERDAAAGVAACLNHVNSLSDKPQLILTGGDLIMDSFEEPIERAKVQWDLFNAALRNDNSIPVRHCLGNHDIWGWHKGKSKSTGSEQQWGKRLALDTLGLAKEYSSFDQAGWHFVILDSVRPDPDDADGYVGGLGDEQLEWLRADLKSAAGKPTLLVTHIPMLSISVLDSKTDKGGDMKVGGGVIYTDWPKVKRLLGENPHVKAVVSGHMHRIDRVEFQGVTHLCNGAVSGSWWKGRHHEAAEGYAVLDLYDDGTVERTYVEYGWKAKQE